MQIFLLTLLGLLLRLINIVKPEGLWNDEYVSWMVAKTHFGEGFFHNILQQCHMPLYYFYLKPFVNFSDSVLRLTSVLPSIIAIPVIYLTGKEFSEKTGRYAAAITAILPFLVYYSQEVRFYSLLFLFSSLTLLFFIKIIKNEKKLNWILYCLSAVSVILTHVLGIFFIFFMTIILFYKKKLINIKVLSFLAFITACIVPLGLNILRMTPSSQWWGVFSYTNIMFLFSDFFSPILTNHINAPRIFFYNREILFLFFITIPSVLGIAGIIKGIKKTKEIILISILMIISIALLAAFGKVVFITKYLIEILPIFILLMAIGFSEDKIGKIMFIGFITINLLSSLTKYYPIYEMHKEGHNIPAIILNKENPDKIIYTYYDQNRFTRYLTINPTSYHISKINRFEYKDSPEIILNNIKKGEKVSVVFLDSVSFINANQINYAKENNFPEMFITFSMIRNELEKAFQENCTNLNSQTIGSWTVLTGIKK